MNSYHKISITILLTAMLFSCQHHFLSQSTTIKHAASWHADFDDFREIQLSSIHLQTYSSAEPKRENRQLALKISQKETFQLDRVIEDTKLNSDKTHELSCEEVEMRTDTERKKVWFVFKPTNHVIATIDIKTGRTTGPNSPTPDWAIPGGGSLIETTCKTVDSNPPPPGWAFSEKSR